MKFTYWCVALVYALTSSSVYAAPESASMSSSALVKESGMLALSGAGLNQAAEISKRYLQNSDIKIIQELAKKYPKFRFPKMAATKLNDGAIRLIVNYKSDLATMDLRNDMEKPMVVNGVVFSMIDLKNIASIGKKLKDKNIKFNETFENSTNSVGLLKIINELFARLSPQALATMGDAVPLHSVGCKHNDVTSDNAICWDEMKDPATGFADPDLAGKLNQYVQKNNITSEELNSSKQNIEKDLKGNHCDTAAPASICATLKSFQTALEKTNPATAVAPVVASTKAEAKAEPADSGSKVTNIVQEHPTATLVALLGAITFGTIMAFKAGGKSKSAPGGSPVLPVSPIPGGGGNKPTGPIVVPYNSTGAA